MGIQFSAMTKQDFQKLGGEVKATHTQDAYSAMQEGLDSTELFGFYSTGDDVSEKQARSNRRAYIKLIKPVFNYVLARGDCSLLSKILGIPNKVMSDVTDYVTAWSVETECMMRIDDMPHDEEILCGAELLKKWIDEFSIEDAIEDEFLRIIKMCCGKDDTSLDDFGELNKEGRGIDLAGGYFLETTFQVSEQKDIIKRGHSIDELSDFIRNTYFESDETRLTFLLNMKGKKSLYGMLQDYITVLPPGMRPKIQNRDSQWTKAYVRVIKANQELELALSGQITNEERIMKYRALDNAVKKLQYKTDPNDKKVSSILEKMKGKRGQIRSDNLGKRQDYSGRCAVIVNPFLPLNKVRIPKQILPKLYRYHILPFVDDKQVFNIISSSNDKECLRIIREQGLLDKIPIAIGRQPTLHKHGIQAFWAEETDAMATEISPLVCPAFNMDFDGDTGHKQVPLSPEAIREVRDLLLTNQNLYLPKTGECTICPRQDMLYGLYICTRSNYTIGRVVGRYSSYESVREVVLMHKVKVYDTVDVNGEVDLAGSIAFKSCFPKNMFLNRGQTSNNNQKLVVNEVNAKTIKPYINALLTKSVDVFSSSVDSIVELGFKIAKLYSPSMSLLTPLHSDTPKAKAYDDAMDKFHESMIEIDDLYDIGLEDSASYNLEFDNKFKEVEDTMKAGIKDKLGEDNGYWLLAASGARGNESNLVQMFAYKGRIAKSSTESFNAIIENSFVSQLSPLEHFISAYGGRKGQIDKSLKTGDTGYAMRQMEHACSSYVINSVDCGTKEGIVIKKSDIAQFTDDQKEVEGIFSKIIEGRFQAKTNIYITKNLASKYSAELDSLEIRSPITCQNPCCKKCYGDDPSINDDSMVGLPIGFIAAHSIGEPGTQLTMKQFQKGGVAGRGDVTSNFDRMNNYIHCADLQKRANEGKYPTYDPIAWADGEVHEVTKDIVNKRITIGDDTSKGIIMPQNAVVKPFAKKGEGLCMKRGDYSIREIEKYADIRTAQMYLVYALYNIYKSECEIISKHFEVLVASMTQHMVIKTTRRDLKVGQYYSSKELLKDEVGTTEYISRLKGVKSLPLLSQSALANIIFENVSKGLSKAIILETEEPLEDPLQRMCMGLPIKAGTYYPDFIENRKRR